MKVRVNLRWSRGSSAFPFQYDVDVGTTVREVCMMVLETNNRWHGNPRFSVVKVISFGTRMESAQAALADGRCVGDFAEDGECYFVFAAG